MKLVNLKYGIIGAGNIGQILIRKLANKGTLLWVVESDYSKFQHIREITNYNSNVFPNISDIQDLPDVIIIAVNDSEIENIAKNLANDIGERLIGKYIFHLSGSLKSDVLSLCENYGAIIFAMHPYQTFYGNDLSALDNALWAVELGNAGKNVIKSIIADLGGKYEFLSPVTLEHKILYHLSAVLASNYLILFLSFAKKVTEISGINPEKFLPPIIQQTINNFLNFGLKNQLPLTGPFARGDFEIIKKHLIAMESQPELFDIYQKLTLSALKILKIENMISESKYNLMLNYLEQFDRNTECK